MQSNVIHVESLVDGKLAIRLEDNTVMVIYDEPDKGVIKENVDETITSDDTITPDVIDELPF